MNPSCHSAHRVHGEADELALVEVLGDLARHERVERAHDDENRHVDERDQKRPDPRAALDHLVALPSPSRRSAGRLLVHEHAPRVRRVVHQPRARKEHLHNAK